MKRQQSCRPSFDGNRPEKNPTNPERAGGALFKAQINPTINDA